MSRLADVEDLPPERCEAVRAALLPLFDDLCYDLGAVKKLLGGPDPQHALYAFRDLLASEWPDRIREVDAGLDALVAPSALGEPIRLERQRSLPLRRTGT